MNGIPNAYSDNRILVPPLYFDFFYSIRVKTFLYIKYSSHIGVFEIYDHHDDEEDQADDQ